MCTWSVTDFRKFAELHRSAPFVSTPEPGKSASKVGQGGELHVALPPRRLHSELNLSCIREATESTMDETINLRQTATTLTEICEVGHREK